MLVVDFLCSFSKFLTHQFERFHIQCNKMALQIGEVKVIDGVKLKGENAVGCSGCCFIEADCHNIGIKEESIGISCILKELLFGFVEVDENSLTLEDLKNEMELNQ